MGIIFSGAVLHILRNTQYFPGGILIIPSKTHIFLGVILEGTGAYQVKNTINILSVNHFLLYTWWTLETTTRESLECITFITSKQAFLAAETNTESE